MSGKRAKARRREQQTPSPRPGAQGHSPGGEGGVRWAEELLTSEQPFTETSLREVQAILHDEVTALRTQCRAPFVLCCIEGKSRAEAAKELGWKEGTVSSRLARAREELQQRLTRRGVLLSAAICAVEVSRTAATAAIELSFMGCSI